MIGAISRNVLAVCGAIVTIIALVASTLSSDVKSWTRTHGIALYYVLLGVLFTALIVINYVSLKKRKLASAHNSAIVVELIRTMPPSGAAVEWLRDYSVDSGIPFKHVETYDSVQRQIETNVIGLDNRKANKAYRNLASAIGDFHSCASINTFPNVDMTSMSLSAEWPSDRRDKARQKIIRAKDDLVKAYDRFLVVSHKHGLDVLGPRG